MDNDKKDADVLIRHKQNGFTTHVPASLWNAHDDLFRADWDVLAGAVAPIRIIRSAYPEVDMPALADVIAKVGGEQLGALIRASGPPATLAGAQTPPLEPDAPSEAA